MRKRQSLTITVISGIIALVLSPYVWAAGSSTQDHSKHIGEKIHESSVENYNLAYHLLDLPGRKEHHLMVYIVDPAGAPVTKAKVGYLVTGPDGRKQKVMAMAMSESFGGDVDMIAKGVYAVKVKIVHGEQKLLDGFQYEMK